jgi:segregation and condensation protein B
MADDLESTKGLFEAMLFIAGEPLSLRFFEKKSQLAKDEVRRALEELVNNYRERDGGLLILEVAGGYQIVTNPRFGPQLREIFQNKKKDKLSKSALEVLAIIAYKQPIHIAAIDELRGANSRQHIGPLMKRNLIKPVQRLEMPGRPMAYGTTNEFLKVFGLNSIKDMPKLSEIKEMNFEPLEEEEG